MATHTTLNNEYIRLSQFLPAGHPRLERIAQEIKAHTGVDCRELLGNDNWNFFEETAERDEQEYTAYSGFVWR